MYSDNDYRYYLEHRLEDSGDFLAHYGVKGMKWKNHNYVIDPRLRERMARGLDNGKPRIGSNPMFQRKRGITSRINGARRRAQLGVGKQLMKSKTGRKVLRKAATRDLKNRVNGAKKAFGKAKKASDVLYGKIDNGEVRGRAIGIDGKKRTLVITSGKNRYTGGKHHRIDLYNHQTGEHKSKSITKRDAFDSWHVGAKANRPGSGKKLARQAQISVGKRLLKSYTGRQILKTAAKNKLKRSVKKNVKRITKSPGGKKVKRFLTDNSTIRDRRKSVERFNKSAVRKYKINELKKKPGKALAPIRKDIKRAKRKAEFNIAKKAVRSEQGRKLLKSAAKHKVKSGVRKLDRKLMRKTLSNKTARKLVGRQAKKQLGVVRDAAREGANSRVNSAKRKANSAVNAGRRKANSAINSARGKVSKATGVARTKTTNAANKARSEGQALRKQATNRASQSASGARSEMNKIRSNTKLSANQLRQRSGEAASSARKKASSVAESARKRASQSANTARSEASKLRRRASKKARTQLNRIRRNR